MEENAQTINLVIYLSSNAVKVGNKEQYCVGGHGYTYDLTKEGKKKLAKDVPTSYGYYTGNNQKANTIVQVEDIASLIVSKADTRLEALTRALILILTQLVAQGTPFKNLCLISKIKEVGFLVRLKKADLEKDKLQIGRLELTTAGERSLLNELVNLVAEATADKKHLIMTDELAAVEGGLGNKQASKQNEIAEVSTVWGTTKEDILTFVGRKEYENPENDFNKLVSASRWYFETNDPDKFFKVIDGYRVYNFGKVEPDKNYYGKLTPDVTYSKLYTKKPIELLDKLFNYTVKRIKNPDGYLSAGDLRHIVSKDVSRMIDSIPAVPKKTELVSPVTKQNGKPVLIELITPVLMSYKIREFLDGMDMQLTNFLNRKDNVFGYQTYYDITDLIYLKEENKKGEVKIKLQPDFTQLKTVFKVPVKHPNASKPVPVTLSVGYDTPERNAFNTVEDPNVKVWLVTDTRNEKGLRYNIIVEATDFIYVHTSAIANLRILTVGELAKS